MDSRFRGNDTIEGFFNILLIAVMALKDIIID